jgi:hypothetical protein
LPSAVAHARLATLSARAIFFERIFHRGVVKKWRQQGTPSGGVGSCSRVFRAAVLGLPLVDAGVAEAVFAAQLRHGNPGIMFLRECYSLKRVRFMASILGQSQFNPDKPEGAGSALGSKSFNDMIL